MLRANIIEECAKIAEQHSVAIAQNIRALSSQAQAGDMARLSASETACYRWPEDTAEHRAMRAAFEDGAAYIAGGS